MKRHRQAKMTKTEFERLKQTLQAAKADERRQPTPADSPTVIYSDVLLRTLIVVERDGQLWLCPMRAGGWASRQRLQMTEEARAQRLRPATDIDAGWLGVE